jgi:chromosome segregation ATPase
MPVDPYEIEDTSDWLGCPTPLETCRHQLRMLENEIEELTLQLHQARQNIFKLVDQHADVSTERDLLQSELTKAKAELADAKRAVVEIETKSNWELIAKDKAISEPTAKVNALKGSIPNPKAAPLR